MAERRYRAPAEGGAVLSDPPPAQVPRLVEANRRRLERADVYIADVPLRELREQARREALEAAREYVSSEALESPLTAVGGLSAPLLLAGHQPELSHPGVWVKHFALNALARKLGGTPLNLVVDNDTLKSTSLRFPVLGPDPDAVHLEALPFDRFDREEPYEDRRVHDWDCFRTFAERAAPLWQNWGYEPLLPRVWPDVLTAKADTIGERFAATRRQWERAWGCDNLELPISRLAKTAAFARFVRHLLADWPRFRVAYNNAVRAYRAAHGIRSRNHPVPDLADDEMPFWGERGPDGRRGRVSTRDRVDPSRLRPRALTLTLFARVCLGDFFIHGIGGGTYDEVTDAIIRDYFGLEPPAYQVLSATLHLPLPAFPTSAADVDALASRERDLYWNPQRHLSAAEATRPDVESLTRRHHLLAAMEPTDKAARRRWYRELREVGDQLRPLVAPKLADVRNWLARARQEAAANAIVQRRDFAWVLYSEEVLRPFLQQFLS
jgi:hypothetical protein